MTPEEETEGLLKRLGIYRRTLALYLEQYAIYGEQDAPPRLIHGIELARQDISNIKQTIRGFGITAEDHPDDEPENHGVNKTHLAKSFRIKQNRKPLALIISLGICFSLLFLLIIYALVNILPRQSITSVLLPTNTSAIKDTVLVLPSSSPIEVSREQPTSAPIMPTAVPPTSPPAAIPTATKPPIIQAAGRWRLPCPTLIVLPEKVDPLKQLPGNIAKEIDDVLISYSLNSFPEFLHGIINYTITNGTSEGIQVRVEKTVLVSIEGMTAPDIINVVNPSGAASSGCGAAGKDRLFEDTPLRLGVQENKYNYPVKYTGTLFSTDTEPDISFFKLNPGELESFVFRFDCQTPGIYKVALNIDYSYGSNIEKLRLSPDKLIICPNRYVQWSSRQMQSDKLEPLAKITNDHVNAYQEPNEQSKVLVSLIMNQSAIILSEKLTSDNINWRKVKVIDPNTIGYSIIEAWVDERYLMTIEKANYSTVQETPTN